MSIVRPPEIENTMNAHHPPVHLTVCLATFDRLLDAQALHSFLESEGVAAEIHDEQKLQRRWFLVLPKAGVHVRVPLESLARARELLNSRADVCLRAIRCPSCGSSRVQYPAMTRRNILPVLIAQLLVLLRIAEREHYCEDCHYAWVRSSAGPIPKAT